MNVNSMERSLTNLKFSEFFLYEWQKCQERAYRNSKNIARLFIAPDGTKKSIKLKSYVPYGETLKYIILKKIYFKAFDLMNKKPLSLAEFKAIAIVIIEKECVLNNKKVPKNDSYYEKIKLKIVKELEKHFKLLDPLDIAESIQTNARIKIDLKELLTEEIKNVNNPPNNIDLIELMQECIFVFDAISIQNINGMFNIILTLPYDVNKEFVHRNCVIGTIIKYSAKILSKELKMTFNKLIVYYPLKIKKEEYSLKDVLYTFQTGTWLKILSAIKTKSTTTTINCGDCNYCENNIWCFYGGLDYKKPKIIEKQITEMI